MYISIMTKADETVAKYIVDRMADAIDLLDAQIGRANYSPLDMWQMVLASGGHFWATKTHFVSVTNTAH